MLAMEFLPGGDLRSHVAKINKGSGCLWNNVICDHWPQLLSYLLNCFHRSSKKDVDLPKQLLGFCVEIADAMEFLSKKGFIHRDLAARNVMLTADTKCKVGICATLVLTMVKFAHRYLIAFSFVSLFAL